MFPVFVLPLCWFCSIKAARDFITTGMTVLPHWSLSSRYPLSDFIYNWKELLRAGEREISHPLLYFVKNERQSWANLKLRAKHFFLVSTWGAGDFSCLPLFSEVLSRELDQKCSS